MTLRKFIEEENPREWSKQKLLGDIRRLENKIKELKEKLSKEDINEILDEVEEENLENFGSTKNKN